ncbi:MAG: Maf family protein, partial [Pseudomonadota bacterium]
VTFDGAVIGSDQVAALNGKPLGKPGSRANAERQLEACRGRTVDFYTSVSIVGGGPPAARHTNTTRVVFRDFGDALLRRYLDSDTPFDCAGSFKAEAAGPVLFERIESDDPTALIGLPLIWLARELERRGVELL